MPTTSHDIERQAAEWVAKRSMGALTSKDEAAFDAWLAADTRALGAYCRLEGTLSRLERVGGAIVGRTDGLSEKTSNPEPGSFLSRRRIMAASGLAASIAALGAGAIWWNGQSKSYASQGGQVREISLSDGSVVTLNTNSEVSVRYTDALREIHLLRGEALFDVAKNKSRPFIVTAGETRVRAVGTSFAVSMIPERPVQVLVKEGIVEVKAGAKRPAVRAKANTRVLIPDEDRYIAVSVAQTKVTRELAWQHGLISFDNQTLQDAAQEYARYSDIRIITDEETGKRTITGSFAANDPIGFAKLTAAALDLQVEVGEKEVRLTAGKKK